MNEGEIQENVKERNFKPLFKLSVGFFLFLIGGGIGGWYFYHLSQPLGLEGDKSILTKQILGRDLKVVQEKENDPIQFEGRYLSARYPGYGVLYDNTKKSDRGKNILEEVDVDFKDPRATFNCIVFDRSTMTSVNDIPAVSFRRNNHQEYNEERSIVAGYGAVVFTKTGSESERTLYILQNGKELSCVVKAGSLTVVDELYNTIIPTIQFNP